MKLRQANEGSVFVVLGVRVTGPWRSFSVLNSFSLSHYHITHGSPIMVDASEVKRFSYVMVVEEKTARENGWLKT